MSTDANGYIVDFLKLLVLSTPQQRLNILRTVNKKQCAVIRQVAYNLMFNTSIEIASEDRNYLKRNSVPIKELASRKICLQRKRSILSHKHLLIKRIATIILKYMS
jgi:hypothetical protein